MLCQIELNAACAPQLLESECPAKLQDRPAPRTSVARRDLYRGSRLGPQFRAPPRETRRTRHGKKRD